MHVSDITIINKYLLLRCIYYCYLTITRTPLSTTQQTQNICITFVQRRPTVFDASPTLYKCYTNVLCLLGTIVVFNLFYYLIKSLLLGTKCLQNYSAQKLEFKDLLISSQNYSRFQSIL